MQLPDTIFSQEELIFFGMAPGVNVSAPMLEEGFALRCYDDVDAMSAAVRSAVVGDPRRNILCWRMRRGEARVIVLLAPTGEVAAYGWMQGWRPFRRVFRGVARSPLMIGPAFTMPRYRGLGLHAVVLRARLSLMPDGMTPVTFAERANRASIKGIEAVGFRQLAEVRLTRLFRVLRVGALVRRFPQR